MKDCVGSSTLDTISLGTSVVVTCVSCKNQELRNKLLSMGIVEGTILQVTNIAPLGDPISVTVRGFKLSLRKSEAQSVEVTSVALWKARSSIKSEAAAIEVKTREKWVVQELSDSGETAAPAL